MIYKLTKISSPSWEKDYKSKEDALNKIRQYICNDCRTEIYFDNANPIMEDYLCSPCGCEFFLEEIEDD
jgi:DNA-directed RNA polymerase subunit RPC12/RpoP